MSIPERSASSHPTVSYIGETEFKRGTKKTITPTYFTLKFLFVVRFNFGQNGITNGTLKVFPGVSFPLKICINGTASIEASNGHRV